MKDAVLGANGSPSSGMMDHAVVPPERGASPVLHVDAEVSLVPGLHRLWVPGLEEDAANSCDAVHVYLSRIEGQGPCANPQSPAAASTSSCAGGSPVSAHACQ